MVTSGARVRPLPMTIAHSICGYRVAVVCKAVARIRLLDCRIACVTISFCPPSIPATDDPAAAVWLYMRFTLSCRDVEDPLRLRSADLNLLPPRDGYDNSLLEVQTVVRSKNFGVGAHGQPHGSISMRWPWRSPTKNSSALAALIDDAGEILDLFLCNSQRDKQR